MGRCSQAHYKGKPITWFTFYNYENIYINLETLIKCNKYKITNKIYL